MLSSLHSLFSSTLFVSDVFVAGVVLDAALALNVKLSLSKSSSVHKLIRFESVDFIVLNRLCVQQVVDVDSKCEDSIKDVFEQLVV